MNLLTHPLKAALTVLKQSFKRVQAHSLFGFLSAIFAIAAHDGE
jgi:hypothetical protein